MKEVHLIIFIIFITVPHQVWAFARVYDPNLVGERRFLVRDCRVEHLVGISTWQRFPSEGSGEERQNHAMVKFSNFTCEIDLMNIPLVGSLYTWSNNHACSRLVKFLISPLTWEMHFLDVCQKRQPRICSNHFPILLDCDCGGIQWEWRYFKFENMWLKANGFVELIRQWWRSYQLQDTPNFILTDKLKALKKDLKS